MMVGMVARRYGKALFSLAQGSGKMETIGEELEEVGRLASSSPEFAQLLNHPILAPKVKKEALTKAFSNGSSKEFIAFLCLLCDKRREGLLPQISLAYRQMADLAKGILEVEAESATPLGEAEAQSLQGAIGAATGKKVRLVLKVSPQLLGGMRLRVGDRVLDTSLAGGLQRLGSSLRQIKVRGL